MSDQPSRHRRPRFNPEDVPAMADMVGTAFGQLALRHFAGPLDRPQPRGPLLRPHPRSAGGQSSAAPPGSPAQQAGGKDWMAATAGGWTTLLGGLAQRLGGRLAPPPRLVRPTRSRAEPAADKSQK